MLTSLDWSIIAVYLALMVWIGLACRGRQRSAADYFIAHGGFPGALGTLLVGLSIAATFFSGITFLAYPGIVYTVGLAVVVTLLTIPLKWLFLRYYFLPRYLSTPRARPYDIVEERFGRAVRMTSAGLFIAARIGWMAVLLYAPTIAVLAAGGLGDEWFWPIVLVTGLACTLYTTFGGIRGVIVTDALQFLLIIFGVAMTVGFILLNMPVPLAEAFRDLGQMGKLRWFKPEWSLTEPFTIWAIIFGGLPKDMGPYVADQMSLQRYLTSRDVGSSVRAFFINLLGVLVVLSLLACVGMLLAAWYHVAKPASLPRSADQIFPYFVATELPSGMAGLVLAAILAATMSSMTSGINALSASLLMDFPVLSRLKGEGRAEVSLARWSSLAIGLAATASTGIVVLLDQQLFDLILGLLGTFLAPVTMCLLIAVGRVRIRPAFMLAALVAGSCTGMLVTLTPQLAKVWPQIPAIHSLWVSAFACLATAMVALAGWQPAAVDAPEYQSAAQDP